MKRKNLFLSLICSVIVAVTMVSFTVYSLVSPTKKNDPQNGNNSNISFIGDGSSNDAGDDIVIDENINETRDGSEELPYVLYSAESFNNMLSTYGSEKQPKREVVKEPVMTEDQDGNPVQVVDEEGNPVYQNKVDQDGNLVYDYVLDEQGNRIEVPYVFELGKNIDFAGQAYVPLFNNGKSFIGTIKGNGFKLKNIAVNVTADTFETDYSYNTSEEERVAHIAIFGDVDGATIKDVIVENMSVNVDEAVRSKVENVEYDASKGFYKEIVVGTIAGVANNATIENVKVNATVNAFAYAIDTSMKVQGYNAVGGLVAVANNVTVTGSTIETVINAAESKTYYVGGVAAYADGVKVNNTFVSTTVNASTTVSGRFVNAAGMFVKAEAIEVVDSNVELKVNEVNEAARAEYVAGLENAHNNSLSKVAGIVVFLTADDANKASVITNVSVVSKVNYDTIFAGAILDVENEVDKSNRELVKLTNVDVNSDVNVLVAYGYARQLIGTVEFNEETTSARITLVGDVKLNSYVISGTTVQNYGATLFTYKQQYNTTVVGGLETLTFKITTAIQEKLGQQDNLRIYNKIYGPIEY